ncbi:alpha beta-hydrolase [Pisolithus croceorrhizus]|nr:alpha beta-hydrolase [Pisolithus croceorrhizus]
MTMSPDQARPTPHTRDYFYVGGSYTTGSGGSEIAHGQLYVEHLAPIEKTRSIPIFFIHGNGMTASNFLNTPDGRPGWADYFLAQGYEVYLVDQPCRGRSPWHQGVDGSQSAMGVYKVESRFTATAKYKHWPQAVLHTQWPGSGTKGDPVFDAFYKSIVPSLTSPVEVSQLVKTAGTQLLDRIGPVALVTHSQSGSLGWILGDSRPHLVRAIVALEPGGPPFQQAVFASTPSRAYGIADIPLTFDPPVLFPSDLITVILERSTFYTNVQQATPARRLTHLACVPVLVVTSESGYHAIYDHCTVQFLRDAGVDVTHTRLEALGIRGNGHMMFMERNSAEIAGAIEHWISKVLRTPNEGS